MADLRYPTSGEALAKLQTPQKVASDRAAWGWTVMALCALTMQIPLQAIFPQASVLLYMAGGLALVRLAPLASVTMWLRWIPAMAVPLLGLLSALWSEAPDQSIRIGVMTLMTVMVALIMADRLSAPRFIAAAHCALLLVVVLSLTRYSPGLPLSGYTGSKNVLAYYAAIGILSSLTILLDRAQPSLLRLSCLATAPLCVLALLLSQSAGALVSTVVGLGVFGFLVVMRRLSAQGRMRALIAVFIIAAPMIIARPVLIEAAHTFQEQVLKKDRTLTGRTYLWERAATIIEARPILGHGYAAFWRQGALEAEGLWRWGHIPDRAGFNFHSDYVEISVALGRVGLVAFVLTMLMLGVPLVVRAILAPSLPLAFFTAFVMSAYLKTSAESGLILAWTFPTALLFAAAVYGRRSEGAPSGGPAGAVPSPAAKLDDPSRIKRVASEA